MKDRQPFVSIVIPNYNGSKFLDFCVSSILKSSYKNFEILLIDDGSTDSSINIVKKFIQKNKKISLYINRQNQGAAASRNKAIKKAKGEIIVFLDNDTEVTKDWLKNLIIPLLEDRDIGATQSLFIDYENRNLIQMAGGKLINQTGWLIPFYQWANYKKVKNKLKKTPIIAISASLAVKREILDLISGFDEKEEVYTEDLDLSWRIWLSGYKVLFVPDSVLYHWTKPVSQRAFMGSTYEKIYFHLTKNSLRSFIKNYSFENLLINLPKSIFVSIARAILVYVKRNDISALKGSFRGFLWIIVNIKDILHERQKVQRYRKFTDLQIQEMFIGESLISIYKKHFSQTKLLF